MKKICITTMTMLMTLCICISAYAAPGITVRLSSDRKTVTVSGVLKSGTQLVSIEVLKDGAYWTRTSSVPEDAKCVDEFRDGTDDAGDFVSYIATVPVNADGSYSLDINALNVPEEPEMRIYTKESGYVYYSPRELKAINSADESTSPTFREAVMASAYVGGAVSERIASMTEDEQDAFWKIYLHAKDSAGGFADLGAAVETIGECADMSYLHTAADKTDFEKFLTRCELYGIKNSNSYDLYFSTGVFKNGELADTQKTNLVNNLLGRKATFYNMTDFIEAFWNETCLAASNGSASRFMLQSVLKNSDRIPAGSLPLFLAAANERQLSACTAIINAAATYTSISDLTRAVEAAIANVPQQGSTTGQNPSTKDRGGSTGGGFTMKNDNSTNGTVDNDTKKEFTDLQNVSWAEKAIYALRDAGIVSGRSETEFDPNSAVTREEFTKLIVLALKCYDDTAVCAFADCSNGAWYTPFVASGQKKGLINGISETEFGVGRSISREEMAMILARAVIGDTPQTADTSGFADDESVSDWAKGAVSYVREAGLMSGVGDNVFEPLASVTRAQAAKVIYELMESGAR